VYISGRYISNGYRCQVEFLQGGGKQTHCNVAGEE
jgi:hypothetical protein